MLLCSKFGFSMLSEGAKNPHVRIALNWGCGSRWTFQIGGLDLDLDFIKFVWILGIFVPNLGSLC